MMDCNYQFLIQLIDGFLGELGASGLVDARKARDQLLDLRSVCSSLDAEQTPEVENVPSP